MFGKGNFEGQFRTKPIVNMGGATRSENREQLLKRAQEERNMREVIWGVGQLKKKNLDGL